MSDVIGAEAVIASFEGAARRVGPTSELITAGAALRIQEKAQATVTVRSGRTKASVGRTQNGPADWSIGGDLGGSGRRLELGGARGGAQPWLFPAADSEVPGFEKVLGEMAGDI